MLLLNNYIRMYTNPKHWYEKREAEKMKQKINKYLIIKNNIGYMQNKLISIPVTKFAIYLNKDINLQKQINALLNEDYQYLSNFISNSNS